MLAHRGCQTFFYESVIYCDTNCAHETIAFYQLFVITINSPEYFTQFKNSNGSQAAAFMLHCYFKVMLLTLIYVAMTTARPCNSPIANHFHVCRVGFEEIWNPCDVVIVDTNIDLLQCTQCYYFKPTACVKLFSLARSHHLIGTMTACQRAFICLATSSALACNSNRCFTHSLILKRATW